MRTACLATGILLLAASGAAGVPDLEALFLPETAVARSWKILREAPEAPDAALRSGGLRASIARHYTRARGAISEVCSLELWEFDRTEQARSVAQALREQGSTVLRSDAILILLHGVRLELGVGSERVLVEGCAELGERTRARIDANWSTESRSAP